MAISSKLLNDGEHVVVSTRTHAKALIGPGIVAAVTLAAAIAGSVFVNNRVDGTAAQVLYGLIWVLAAVVLVWWVLRPFVSWWTTTYTFTNRRLMFRTGFVAKEGRTIPLNRISGVDFDIDLSDRIFGCGTLVVSDASEMGRVELHDIPRVEEVQKLVSAELHRQASSRYDDGT